MTIKEAIAKALIDLMDDKSQAARYLFVIALVVICSGLNQSHTVRILEIIIGGFLVLIGAKSRS